jgi:hypothetical protein
LISFPTDPLQELYCYAPIKIKAVVSENGSTKEDNALFVIRMAVLSNRPIENKAVGGMRSTQQITVLIDNRDSVNSGILLIQGYILNGTRTLYVLELFPVVPNQVVTKQHFANLDAFEFVFTTGGAAARQTEISVWGKDAAGQLVAAHRLVASENQ